MSEDTPEAVARDVLRTCSNCDLCRDLLAEAPCQFFPRLFMLGDRMAAGGEAPTGRELADLIDLCNSCGQCPCTQIQTEIREAKNAFVARDGLPLRVRLVEDVQLVGRLCGTLPSVTNAVLSVKPVARLVKRAFGIHPDRRIPTIPKENFDAWAKREGLHAPVTGAGRKVAYFVGCTARHLYPQVAIATVEVLRANGIGVWVPPQKCCGMPTHLEGDRPFTYRLAEFNLPVLAAAVRDGYDVVTACPTCSFALKTVLARGARFAPERRAEVVARLARANGDVAKVHDDLVAETLRPTGRAGSAAKDFDATWVINHIATHPHAGEGIDDGYFADIDASLRIEVAAHSWELGEYLRDLAAEGALKPIDGVAAEKLGYFPPCHLREQEMGRPWAELLKDLFGAKVETVGRADDCCGLGGVMGFKTDFHAASLAMGRGLMARTATAEPDRVVTECLGCRVQFEQMQPLPVSHPVELLAAAYRAAAKAEASARLAPAE